MSSLYNLLYSQNSDDDTSPVISCDQPHGLSQLSQESSSSLGRIPPQEEAFEFGLDYGDDDEQDWNHQQENVSSFLASTPAPLKQVTKDEVDALDKFYGTDKFEKKKRKRDSTTSVRAATTTTHKKARYDFEIKELEQSLLGGGQVLLTESQQQEQQQSQASQKRKSRRSLLRKSLEKLTHEELQHIRQIEKKQQEQKRQFMNVYNRYYQCRRSRVERFKRKRYDLSNEVDWSDAVANTANQWLRTHQRDLKEKLRIQAQERKAKREQILNDLKRGENRGYESSSSSSSSSSSEKSSSSSSSTSSSPSSSRSSNTLASKTTASSSSSMDKQTKTALGSLLPDTLSNDSQSKKNRTNIKSDDDDNDEKNKRNWTAEQELQMDLNYLQDGYAAPPRTMKIPFNYLDQLSGYGVMKTGMSSSEAASSFDNDTTESHINHRNVVDGRRDGIEKQKIKAKEEEKNENSLAVASSSPFLEEEEELKSMRKIFISSQHINEKGGRTSGGDDDDDDDHDDDDDDDDEDQEQKKAVTIGQHIRQDGLYHYGSATFLPSCYLPLTQRFDLSYGRFRLAKYRNDTKHYFPIRRGLYDSSCGVLQYGKRGRNYYGEKIARPNSMTFAHGRNVARLASRSLVGTLGCEENDGNNCKLLRMLYRVPKMCHRKRILMGRAMERASNLVLYCHLRDEIHRDANKNLSDQVMYRLGIGPYEEGMECLEEELTLEQTPYCAFGMNKRKKVVRMVPGVTWEEMKGNSKIASTVELPHIGTSKKKKVRIKSEVKTEEEGGDDADTKEHEREQRKKKKKHRVDIDCDEQKRPDKELALSKDETYEFGGSRRHNIRESSLPLSEASEFTTSLTDPNIEMDAGACSVEWTDHDAMHEDGSAKSPGDTATGGSATGESAKSCCLLSGQTSQVASSSGSLLGSAAPVGTKTSIRKKDGSKINIENDKMDTTTVTQEELVENVKSPPLSSYVHLPGTTPPTPSSLDETRLVLGPSDKFAKVEHAAYLDETTYNLTLSYLLTQLGAARLMNSQSDNRRETLLETHSQLLGFVERVVKNIIEQVPQNFRKVSRLRTDLTMAMGGYCSCVANAGLRFTKDGDLIKQDEQSDRWDGGNNDTESVPSHQTPNGEANICGRRRTPHVHMNELGSIIYNGCQQDLSNSNFDMFPEVHLTIGVALLASSMPPAASEIISRECDHNSNSRTPFDLMRAALLSIADNQLLDHTDGLSASSTSKINPSQLEDTFRKAATVFERCVGMDPVSVEFRSWHVAALCGSMLLCSRKQIVCGETRGCSTYSSDDLKHAPKTERREDGPKQAHLELKKEEEDASSTTSSNNSLLDNDDESGVGPKDYSGPSKAEITGHSKKEEGSEGTISDQRNYDEAWQATRRAVRGLVDMNKEASCDRVMGSRYHVAMSSLLEWREVMELLVDSPRGKNSVRKHLVYKQVRRLHAYHTIQWSMAEPSEWTLNRIEDLVRTDEATVDATLSVLAGMIEQRPGDRKFWRALVSALGPLGRVVSDKKRRSCEKSRCGSCKRVRKEWNIDHSALKKRKKKLGWWGANRTSWWDIHLLHLPSWVRRMKYENRSSDFVFKVRSTVEKLLRKIDFKDILDSSMTEARCFTESMAGIGPEPSQQIDVTWLGTEDVDDHYNDFNVDIIDEKNDATLLNRKSNEDDDRACTNTLPRFIAEIMTSEESRVPWGSAKSSDNPVDVPFFSKTHIGRSCEALCQIVIVTCHLYSPMHPNVREAVWCLAERFWLTRKPGEELSLGNDCDEWSALLWLVYRGLNVSQILHDVYRNKLKKEEESTREIDEGMNDEAYFEGTKLFEYTYLC